MTPNDSQAKAVPLMEQLCSVPADAKLRIDTPNALGCMDTCSIPVGRLCHEAAAALSALAAGKVEATPVATTRIENGFVKVTWHTIPPHGTNLYAASPSPLSADPDHKGNERG